MIKNPAGMHVVNQLSRKKKDIENQIWQAANEVFVPGLRVGWLHQGLEDKPQEGVILEVIGAAWSSIALRVNNTRTNRIVDVDLFYVQWVEALQEEHIGGRDE